MIAGSQHPDNRSTTSNLPFYQMSNICGGLVRESVSVLGALGSGTPLQIVREQALDGTLFRQRSWQARRRFWYAVHARYLSDSSAWVLSDLTVAAHQLGSHHPTTQGLLYLHFVLRDRLTRDWLLGPVWDRWVSGQHRLTRDDVQADLDTLLADCDVRWTEASRAKLATSLLSAIRDFGLARGVQVKHLQRPVITPAISAHLLRLLIEEGVRGASLIAHPYWRLFFRTQEDVAGELATLSVDKVIQFERAGSTVVLETPWSAQ